MDLRLYSFCNFYLSSIQQGIQTAHLVQELNNKYLDATSPKKTMLYDWGQFHKTIIVLNGGIASDIENTYSQLEQYCEGNTIPFAKFHEDQKSLSGTMTCCGLIVPDELYESVDFFTAATIVGGDIADQAGMTHIESTNTSTKNFGNFEKLRFYITTDTSGRKIVGKVYDESMPEWQIIRLIKSCSLAK